MSVETTRCIAKTDELESPANPTSGFRRESIAKDEDRDGHR
jgi:hypothetical protein